MNNDQDLLKLNEIEGAIMRDDPALASRFRLLDPPDVRRDRRVYSLLVASMLLLGYGLSTPSVGAWFAGGAAFIASFMVDGHYEHRVARATAHEPAGQGRNDRSRWSIEAVETPVHRSKRK
jgi:hypothetical protein